MSVFLTTDYWVPFFWGLVILASWLGWGELAGWLLGGRAKRTDWGLKAGWGMAVTLVVGGLLQLPRAATQNVLMVFALAGAAIWGLRQYERIRVAEKRGKLRIDGRNLAFHGPLIVLVVFLYATSVQAFDVNWWDDLPAYLVMVKRLLQTGAMLDPYSWRRLATYGGQQLLDAQLLAGGTLFNIDLLELGLAKIMFARLLVGMAPLRRVRGLWRKGAVAAAILVMLLVPVPHLNTQSEMTGVVMALTLLRTLMGGRIAGGDRRGLAVAAAAGLIGAGLSTLRMNFVPAAVLAIGLTYIVRMVLERRRWKQHVAELGVAAGAFAAGLLPWCVILYESSESLFYPLMRGTQRPEYKILAAPMTLMQKAQWLGGFVAHPAALVLVLPLAAALLRRKRWRTELPVYLGGLATMAMTVLAFNRSDFANLYRYTFPVVFGSAAAAVIAGLASARAREWAAAGVMGLLVAAVFMPAGVLFLWNDRVGLWGKMDQSPLWSVARSVPNYRVAQEAIPAGEPVFVAAAMPNLLDFTRNRLLVCDAPGAASPDPGLPIFEGPEAVKEYLRKKGIRYVMFVDPNEDLTNFSRSTWERAKEHADQMPETFRFAYPFTLAFLDDMEALGKSEQVVYRDRTLCVVRLR